MPAELARLEPTESWLFEMERLGLEVVRTAAFVALFHEALIGFPFAAPSLDSFTQGEPEPAVATDVLQLTEIFASRGMPLAIEFNEPLFPGLASRLQNAGLVRTEREPLMLLAPADFKAVGSDEARVVFLSDRSTEGELVAYQSIFERVLQQRSAAPSKGSIEALRNEMLSYAGGHALATIDGRPVGTGFATALGGVCEITRVATVPEARRRGVAASVTSFMLESRFEAGDDLAWLTASGEPALRLYCKLGFRQVGHRAYFADSEA